MKLQLDFDSKTISIEDDCELKEFITVIQRILPDWQKWTLRSFTTIPWGVGTFQTHPYLDRIGTTAPLPEWPIITCATT